MTAALRLRAAAVLLAAACLSLALVARAQAAPGDVSLVSAPSTGIGDSGTDVVPAISGDGSFVAYLHEAPFGGLEEATPGAAVYLRTMATTSIVPVNVPVGETRGNGFEAGSPALDGSGRYLSFVSEDPDISPDDTDFQNSPAIGKSVIRDAFVYDRVARRSVLVSRGNGPAGVAANANSNLPSISPDGRYVAFGTEANNLIPRRVYGHVVFGGVYVRDLRKKTTTLVSLTDGRNGEPIDGFDPSLSKGGSLVAFAGRAGPRGDRHAGIYVRDVRRGRTLLVSHQGGLDCVEPSLAADGRTVAYTCEAKSRAKGINQIYVTDLAGGRTSLVSAAAGRKGRPGGGDSAHPSISANGRLVAFESYANDLGPADNGRVVDVFVKDLKNGRVILASRASGGGPAANAGSGTPSLAADGRFVAFESRASNLTPEDSIRDSSVFRYQVLP